jgi:hypothetical protein
VSADPAEGDDGGHDPVDAHERHEPGATRPCEQERDAESERHPASDEEEVVRPSRELAHGAQPGRSMLFERCVTSGVVIFRARCDPCAVLSVARKSRYSRVGGNRPFRMKAHHARPRRLDAEVDGGDRLRRGARNEDAARRSGHVFVDSPRDRADGSRFRPKLRSFTRIRSSPSFSSAYRGGGARALVQPRRGGSSTPSRTTSSTSPPTRTGTAASAERESPARLPAAS